MKKVSLYRDALMGIAILWIMVFHAEVTFPAWLRPLTWIKETGYGGVDIFLFLSGMGLYVSLHKNPSLSRFFSNRAKRILPTYWFIVLGAAFMEFLVLHRRTPIMELFYMVTTLGFWINAAKFDWYVPSLLVFYALFPLFFFSFSKSSRRLLIYLIWALGGWAISYALINTGLDYLLIFTTRIPIFFLGGVSGYWLVQGPSPRRSLPIQCILGLVGLGWLAWAFISFSPAQRWHNGTWWYPFLFITPLLCSGFAIALAALPVSRSVQQLKGGLAWLGRYSLEIYLVHTLVFGLHKQTDRYFSFDPSGICAYGTYVLISLPLAYVLHHFIERLLHLITHREIEPIRISAEQQRVFDALLVLAGWVALGLQWHIVLQNASQKGISSFSALGNFLSYFTILTNAVIAFSLNLRLVYPTSKLSRFFEKPSVQTALTGCIILVSLIYHAALAKAWNPQGLQWWTNFLLHDAIPLGFVLRWVMFVPKGDLKWKQPVVWLVYPLLYLLWMMIRGSVTGFYPYPFVDVAWHGYPKVLFNIGILVLGFVLGFYALIVIDKWLGKHFNKIFPGK